MIGIHTFKVVIVVVISIIIVIVVVVIVDVVIYVHDGVYGEQYEAQESKRVKAGLGRATGRAPWGRILLFMFFVIECS